MTVLTITGFTLAYIILGIVCVGLLQRFFYVVGSGDGFDITLIVLFWPIAAVISILVAFLKRLYEIVSGED
jgi:hypothetical protein